MNEMNEMTYSESANRQMVTWERCMRELANHGLTNEEDQQLFWIECWCHHAIGHGTKESATMDAKHLMDWLGY